MPSSLPTSIARITLFAALVVPAVSVYAQIPGGSSARDIPNAVQQSEQHVSKVIATAEDHFRKGKLNLEDNKRDQARDEFDKAVDSILESGLDVRANHRLQGFYLELVERIYREEVPLGRGPIQPDVAELVAQNTTTAQQKSDPPVIGFHEQKFEPSPLDELSKLVLTADEKNVSDSDVVGPRASEAERQLWFQHQSADSAIHQLLPGTRSANYGERSAPLRSIHENGTTDLQGRRRACGHNLVGPGRKRLEA